MGMILRGLGGLDSADDRIDGSAGAARAFLSGVENPEVYYIYAELFAELVDDRLGCEGAERRARSAVGGGLGLVVDDVVGIYDDVGDVVWREDALSRRSEQAIRGTLPPRIGGQRARRSSCPRWSLPS